MKGKSTYLQLQFWGILVSGISSAIALWYSTESGLGIVCLLIVTSLILAFWVHTRLFSTIRRVKAELERITKGVVLDDHDSKMADAELAGLTDELSSMMTHATVFAKNLAKVSSESASIEQLDTSVPLNAALVDTEIQLKKLKVEEEKRNWVIKGVAELGEIIRQNLDSEMTVLADLMISRLVKHTGAVQGGFYLVQEEEGSPFIQLVSCYAYDRKKYQTRRIEWGQGMIGESIRDKDLIYLTEIPDDYVKITSGLGDANPRTIVICPLSANEKTIGAIELASFAELEEHKLELIRKVCESLASTIVTMQNNWRNLQLLKQADVTEQALREKESILTQNAEELTATQEELNRKLVQIEHDSNLNRNILTAINKSNAMVEYDMSGRILDANDLYLNIMGYSKEELLGKSDALLLAEEESAHSNLNMLWDSLRQGNFNSGQFKRKSKKGQEVWIEASFNPILDLQGKPFKVLMLAQFITDILSKENDLKNKINALNDFFPYAEFGFDHKVKNCNALFLQMFGLTRKTSKEFNLVEYLKSNNQQIHVAQGDFDFQVSASKHLQRSCELNINGHLRHFMFCYSPLKDLNGKLQGFSLTIQDLTQGGVSLEEVINLKVG